MYVPSPVPYFRAPAYVTAKFPAQRCPRRARSIPANTHTYERSLCSAVGFVDVGAALVMLGSDAALLRVDACAPLQGPAEICAVLAFASNPLTYAQGCAHPHTRTSTELDLGERS